MYKAKLEVRHDGIGNAHARVLVDVGLPALQVCSLDQVIEAALQSDAELAEVYAGILSQIAPELYLVIVKEKDGSVGNGCCWFAVTFRHGINGDTITEHSHRFTRREFRGWRTSEGQEYGEEVAILARAAKAGLAHAEHWRLQPASTKLASRTVAEFLAK